MALRLFLLFLLSSCYQHSFPVTPNVVSYSTFEIFMGQGQGTAWVVDEHHVVTAGHVCERGGAEDGNKAVLLNNYRRIVATPIAWDYGGGIHDICILHTEKKLERPLVIADRMPEVGERVAFVGYPYGNYLESEGQFLGDIDGDSEYNNAAFTAPCGPGASGSAVYTSRGVWGVLVRLRTDGGGIHSPEEGCAAVDLTELRRMLEGADIDYLSPPLDPNDLP